MPPMPMPPLPLMPAATKEESCTLEGTTAVQAQAGSAVAEAEKQTAADIVPPTTPPAVRTVRRLSSPADILPPTTPPAVRTVRRLSSPAAAFEPCPRLSEKAVADEVPVAEVAEAAAEAVEMVETEMAANNMEAEMDEVRALEDSGCMSPRARKASAARAAERARARNGAAEMGERAKATASDLPELEAFGQRWGLW